MTASYNSTFLMNDSTVKSFGRTSYGSIDASNILIGITGVSAIANGQSHGLFLMNDGTVKTVGSNDYGQCGNGNTTAKTTLSAISGLTGVKQVSGGNAHSVFLMNDGTVRAVGGNWDGQCGTGTTASPRLAIYTIPGLTGVKQVSAGSFHNLFLMNDGTVKSIGYNSNGQCGTGGTALQLSLYTIPGLTGVRQVFASSLYSVFLMNDGTVKTVGNNAYGQCGTGTSTNSQLTIYTVPGITTAKSINCTDGSTAVLLNDGTVKTFGDNRNGQCGAGSGVSFQFTPYTIPGLTNVKEIASGELHVVFLLQDGTVKSIGYNSNGQCCTGNTTTQFVPYTTNITSVKNIWDWYDPYITYKNLIKANGNYYSINSAYYNTTSKTYNPLTLAGGTIPNTNDVQSYGFDSISDLLTYKTINSETFLPADKMFSSYSIQRYKPK